MADSLSSKPWDGNAARWPDAASYCESCLVDLNDGNGPKKKELCHLPVREPGGALNRAGMGAAAAALAGARGNGMTIPAAAKKAAAKKLRDLYRRCNLDVPPMLQKMAM